MANSMSLAQLSEWCARRFGPRTVQTEGSPRRYDVPWLAIDHARVTETFGWHPSRRLADILDEIADHARSNPGWLSLTEPF